MSFMKPQIYFGRYFKVETMSGSEIVLADLVDRGAAPGAWVRAEEFEGFVAGGIADPFEVVECAEGWLARLAAPGYMDCTDWTVHKSEAEAREYLAEMYGDDDDNGE